MSTFPKRADHFKKWASLMLEQATVPDRPQYKKSGKGGRKPRKLRRKRFLRKRKRKAD